MPSSPNGPCSTGKTTSIAGQAAPGRDRELGPPSERQTPSRPTSISTDLVPGLAQAGRDRRGRGERHLVLGRAAAPEHRDPARAAQLVAVVGVVGVEVVVDVVVEVVRFEPPEVPASPELVELPPEVVELPPEFTPVEPPDPPRPGRR